MKYHLQKQTCNMYHSDKIETPGLSKNLQVLLIKIGPFSSKVYIVHYHGRTYKTLDTQFTYKMIKLVL